MDKFERMVDRFQLLIDIEYDRKRVEHEVRRSERKATKTRMSGKENMRCPKNLIA